MDTGHVLNLHVIHWPGQEGGHFLMTPTWLCVFVMPGHMAIIDQLLDIFWTAASSCLHILSTLAVHSIRHCQKCCPATGGRRSCSGKMRGAHYTVCTTFSLLASHFGVWLDLSKHNVGEQFFFSKKLQSKAEEKSMSSCCLASSSQACSKYNTGIQ